MAMVTKPGGSFSGADYALPRNRVASALAYHIVEPYGRGHYEARGTLQRSLFATSHRASRINSDPWASKNIIEA
jgi:hypothetical protein